MPRDVFEEDPRRFALPDDAGDIGPEVPLVVGPPTLPCGAERLARIAREGAIHGSTPCPPVEGGEVSPDRGGGEDVLLRPDEGLLRVGLPFDETGCVELRLGKHEPEVEPAGAGAEGQSAKGGMYAHVTSAPCGSECPNPPTPR